MTTKQAYAAGFISRCVDRGLLLKSSQAAGVGQRAVNQMAAVGQSRPHMQGFVNQELGRVQQAQSGFGTAVGRTLGGGQKLAVPGYSPLSRVIDRQLQQGQRKPTLAERAVDGLTTVVTGTYNAQLPVQASPTSYARPAVR